MLTHDLYNPLINSIVVKMSFYYIERAL